MHEALFYDGLENNKVRCRLCPHFCVIADGDRGRCSVRENQEGKLYSLVYGKAISTAVDPIEKKPLFHFMPGSFSYSIATMGCNFRCEFCQNCEISQPKENIYGKKLTPQKIVEDAVMKDCQSIAYTYTEPTIFFEYAYDIARLAKEKDLKNVFVTNGFTSIEAIEQIAPYLDAVNVDLKSFNKKFYREIAGGKLKPVLEAIRKYHELGIFIEITTLVIPGRNDSDKELSEIAGFIASLSNDIPWHVSRFYPMFHMKEGEITSEETIKKAVDIGKKAGLKYIYAGNVPGNDFESTYCPKCNGKVIERYSYSLDRINLKAGNCMYCGEKINVVI